MPFQVSPGINTSEIDLTTVVPNVSTSIGAIAGGFQWGPVLERTSITTENDLVNTFGKPDSYTYQSHMVAANYLAYSNNLIVTRAVGAAAMNSHVGDDDVGGSATQVLNSTDWDTETMGTRLFIGKYPGSLGNSLKALAIDSVGWADAVALAVGARSADQTLFMDNFDSAPGTSTSMANANGGLTTGLDEMHILVVDEDGLWSNTPGEVLEKFAFVSKALDAKKIDGSSNYVSTVLRNESKYIWAGLPAQFSTLSVDTGGSYVDAGSVMAGSLFKRLNHATVGKRIIGGSLTLGVSDNVYGAGNLTSGLLRAAIDLFAEPEVVDITLWLGGMADTADGQYIKGKAEARKDCVAFVSPNSASVVNAGTGQVAALKADSTTLGSSSYAVMDGAWKYQYDRYNDVFRYVPMNGDIAGLCARTDFTNDAWWSPAGMNRGTIKNIVKLSWEPTKADRDEMYKNNINPIITMTGAGVLLWGDKTMQTVPSAFDRINVRRLFIVLEKAISIAAKAMLFEFNDEFTRAQFVNLVEPFLREVQGRRGITDFKVVCDGSNNTGQVIDTNNFVGDIYIKPSRSINYIQLNFIAARSDVSFSEIGG
jgi:phage tail sheath protein FI